MQTRSNSEIGCLFVNTISMIIHNKYVGISVAMGILGYLTLFPLMSSAVLYPASSTFQPSGNTGIVSGGVSAEANVCRNVHRFIRWNCNLVRRGVLVRINRWRNLCSFLLPTEIKWSPTNHTKMPITQY